ncbi:6-phospho-3-hexuloisomerase [Psychrobacillus soli]|uniref:SIS domain-containing protein n=1 Tax=Psychrobacillus soli TaxID=1543965 RepID=A0A544TLC8_9BACI|nr:6-phospho-3-hexuloisomerase [Psychrobacillus soli]TQR18256.1 SIS domain-containing protein [Psychrobacillus soli]
MNTISTILGEISTVCANINDKEYNHLVEIFQSNNRFFFSGEGRSGLIAKAIAMRLMHSGKTVFVIGETTTPAIEKSDVLIVVSGSGKTPNTLNILESASKVEALIFLITTNRDVLELYSGLLVHAATKYRLPGEPDTIQPLGNQFDQAAHLVLDAAIIDSFNNGQSNDTMKSKHSNLE